MKKLILLIAIAFLINNTIKAQGCSDAGFCSVSNGHNGLANITTKHLLELGAIVGAGDFDVKYFSPYLSYTNKVNANFSLGAKITYSNARGSFGSIGALGDAFITGNYKFKTK